MRRDIHVVVYHDLTLHETALTGQLFLSTHPDVFRKHIQFFRKNFDIIGLSDLLEESRLPRKPLLITFDDAYRSVLTIGGPTLRDANASSLFFIIPSVVTGSSIPIDNVLSFAVDNMGLMGVLSLLKRPFTKAMSVGEIVSKYISTMSLRDIAELKARIFSVLGTTEADVRREAKIFLDVADVRMLPKYGIEIGNHSMTHSHFRSLSVSELDVEIRQSRIELERLSSRLVNCLSIPYGDERDATREALSLARDSGHEAVFLVHARSNRFRPCKHLYYRISLRNERLLGMSSLIKILPVVRSVRDSLGNRQLSDLSEA